MTGIPGLGSSTLVCWDTGEFFFVQPSFDLDALNMFPPGVNGTRFRMMNGSLTVPSGLWANGTLRTSKRQSCKDATLPNSSMTVELGYTTEALPITRWMAMRTEVYINRDGIFGPL